MFSVQRNACKKKSVEQRFRLIKQVLVRSVKELKPLSINVWIKKDILKRKYEYSSDSELFCDENNFNLPCFVIKSYLIQIKKGDSMCLKSFQLFLC